MPNNLELQNFWNALKRGTMHGDKRKLELINKLISYLSKPISRKKKIDAVHKLLDEVWYIEAYHASFIQEWVKLVKKIHNQKNWEVDVIYSWDKNHNTSLYCKLPNGEVYK